MMKISNAIKEMEKKVCTFKGFVIAKDSDGYFLVYTKDEWSYGWGLRYPEFECGSIEECKENIKSY